MSALLAAVTLLMTPAAARQAAAPAPPQPQGAAQPQGAIDPGLYAGMRWRSIGPDRGGRSIAVAGSAARPNEYYFGAVGGGVWKTTDFGMTWAPVGDSDFSTSSVGAIAIAPSNPDVVYAGMGESCFRGNIIQGDGVYKTTDARQDLDARRARRHRSRQQDPRSSDESRPGLRGRARPLLRRAPGARRLSHARTAARPGSRCSSATTAAARSTSRWIRRTPTCSTPRSWQVYRTPWSMESGGPGQRALTSPPTAARRGPTSRRTRVCRPGCGAASASRSPAPTAIASTRSSKTTTAACSSPTMPARPGSRPTRTATCGSARSTTRTSTPTRSRRTPSTC